MACDCHLVTSELTGAMLREISRTCYLVSITFGAQVWSAKRTSRENGSFAMRSSVDFWYRLISRSATVPGR